MYKTAKLNPAKRGNRIEARVINRIICAWKKFEAQQEHSAFVNSQVLLESL